MTVDEYRRKVHDRIVGLETRSLTKSYQPAEVPLIVKEAQNTLVNSNLTPSQIQEFWRILLDELTIARKQANSALLAIIAAAEQAIAQYQPPKTK